MIRYFTPQNRIVSTGYPYTYYFSLAWGEDSPEDATYRMKSIANSLNHASVSIKWNYNYFALACENQNNTVIVPFSNNKTRENYPKSYELGVLFDLHADVETYNYNTSGKAGIVLFSSSTSPDYYLALNLIPALASGSNKLEFFGTNSSGGIIADGGNNDITLSSKIRFIRIVVLERGKIVQVYNSSNVLLGEKTFSSLSDSDWYGFQGIISYNTHATEKNIVYYDICQRHISEGDRFHYTLNPSLTFDNTSLNPIYDCKDESGNPAIRWSHYNGLSNYSLNGPDSYNLFLHGLIVDQENGSVELKNANDLARNITPEFQVFFDVTLNHWSSVGEGDYISFRFQESGSSYRELRFFDDGSIALYNQNSELAIAYRSGKHDYTPFEYGGKNTRFVLTVTLKEIKLQSYLWTELVDVLSSGNTINLEFLGFADKIETPMRWNSSDSGGHLIFSVREWRVLDYRFKLKNEINFNSSGELSTHLQYVTGAWSYLRPNFVKKVGGNTGSAIYFNLTSFRPADAWVLEFDIKITTGEANYNISIFPGTGPNTNPNNTLAGRLTFGTNILQVRGTSTPPSYGTYGSANIGTSWHNRVFRVRVEYLKNKAIVVRCFNDAGLQVGIVELIGSYYTDNNGYGFNYGGYLMCLPGSSTTIWEFGNIKNYHGLDRAGWGVSSHLPEVLRQKAYLALERLAALDQNAALLLSYLKNLDVNGRLSFERNINIDSNAQLLLSLLQQFVSSDATLLTTFSENSNAIASLLTTYLEHLTSLSNVKITSDTTLSSLSSLLKENKEFVNQVSTLILRIAYENNSNASIKYLGLAGLLAHGNIAIDNLSEVITSLSSLQISSQELLEAQAYLRIVKQIFDLSSQSSLELPFDSNINVHAMLQVLNLFSILNSQAFLKIEFTSTISNEAALKLGQISGAVSNALLTFLGNYNISGNALLMMINAQYLESIASIKIDDLIQQLDANAVLDILQNNIITQNAILNFARISNVSSMATLILSGAGSFIISGNAKLKKKLERFISSNAELALFFGVNLQSQASNLITQRTKTRNVTWGQEHDWGSISWGGYDPLNPPSPGYNQVSHALIGYFNNYLINANAALRDKVRVFLESNGLLKLKRKNFVLQNSRTWTTAASYIISLSHPDPDQYYSSETVIFRIADHVVNDSAVSYIKWVISENPLASPIYTNDKADEVSFGVPGGPFEGNTFYLRVALYSDDDTFLELEEREVLIDSVSTIINGLTILTYPLYEKTDFTISVDSISNLAESPNLLEFAWRKNSSSWQLYSLIEPVFPLTLTREFDGSELSTNDKIDIYVKVVDRANNEQQVFAGYNYDGDSSGLTSEDYEVKQRYVYQFRLWEGEYSLNNLNGKYCPNDKKVLERVRECVIAENSYPFTVGVHKKCPNCKSSLKVVPAPKVSIFELNFQNSLPSFGDDKDGPGILRYNPNLAFYNLYNSWKINFEIKNERYGYERIDLGVVSHSDITNGSKKGYVEIQFSKENNFNVVFYSEDSFDLSGFGILQDNNFTVIQGGIVKSGITLSFIPQKFIPSGTYYRFRLILVNQNGLRTYLNWQTNTKTLTPLTVPISSYNGSYSEFLINEGRMIGFYQSSIPTLILSNLSGVKKPYTSEWKFTLNGNGGFLLDSSLQQVNQSTTKVFAKIKSLSDNLQVRIALHSGEDEYPRGYGSFITLEKDKWQIISYDFIDTLVGDDEIPFGVASFIACGLELVGFSSASFEIDYLVLSNSSKKKFIYLTYLASQGACFNDKRIAKADNLGLPAPQSYCSIGYDPVEIGEEEDRKQYYFERPFCNNDQCPNYSSIQNLEDFIEIIYDSTIPSAKSGISFDSNYNLSGLMVCPNNKKKSDGTPQCTNNARRRAIPPVYKTCSRHEGYKSGGNFHYRCDKFSQNPESSSFDTSGQNAMNENGISKIPANRIVVNNNNGNPVYSYEPKEPYHYRWDYRESDIICDGKLRDTGLPCGSVLVGHAIDQRCPECNTPLVPYERSNFTPEVEVCTNEKYNLKLSYDCDIYGSGSLLHRDLSHCPSCNTELIDFNHYSLLNKYPISNSVTLNQEELNKLRSGGIYTHAVRGWDILDNEAYAGFVSGIYVSSSWSSLRVLRPFFPQGNEEDQFEERRDFLNQELDENESKRLAISQDLINRQLDVLKRGRDLLHPETLALNFGASDEWQANFINEAHLVYDSMSSIVNGKLISSGNKDRPAGLEPGYWMLKNGLLNYIKSTSIQPIIIELSYDNMFFSGAIAANIKDPTAALHLMLGNYSHLLAGYFIGGSANYIRYQGLPSTNFWFKLSILRQSSFTSHFYYLRIKAVKVSYTGFGNFSPSDPEYSSTLVFEEQLLNDIFLTSQGFSIPVDNFNVNNLKFRWYVYYDSVKMEVYVNNNLIGFYTFEDSIGTLPFSIGSFLTSVSQTTLSSLKIKGINASDLVISGAGNNNAALVKHGQERNSSTSFLDESDLFYRENILGRKGFAFSGEWSETYYQLEFDPSPLFNTRQGQPMRVLDSFGWTCLNKARGLFYSPSGSMSSSYCANYKKRFSESEAINHKYTCPLCSEKMFRYRLDIEAVSLSEKTSDEVHPYNIPSIDLLLDKNHLPGLALEDYLMLKRNNNSDQEADGKLVDFGQNSNKSKILISNWESYNARASYFTNPGNNFELVGDIDYFTFEHCKQSHVLLGQNHPLGHGVHFASYSVGQKAINQYGYLYRMGTNSSSDLNRAGVYQFQVYRFISIPQMNEQEFRGNFSDLRFSYYLPEQFVYDSLLEVSANVAGTASNATYRSIDFICEFLDQHDEPLLAVNVARPYVLYDSYYWSSARGKNKHRNLNINPWSIDQTAYFDPHGDPVNIWQFGSYDLYREAQRVLSASGRTWGDIRKIKLTFNLYALRNQGLWDDPSFGSVKPQHRPNLLGFFIGEIFTGLSDKLEESNGLLKYPLTYWDGLYYYRFRPFNLALNPSYRELFKQVQPNLSSQSNESDNWKIEQSIYLVGPYASKFLKRVGDSIVSSNFRYSYNWQSVSNPEDIVVLEDGR